MKDLTSREKQVLLLIANGYSKAAAAAVLGCSPETVRTHAERIRIKLDAVNAANSVAKAMRLGIIR